MSRRGVVDGPLDLLPRDPRSALARLRTDSRGLDCLIGLWGALAEAVESGWTSRGDHHDRLLNLLGHPAGSAPEDLEAARASLTLLRAHDAAAVASELAGARAMLRALCAGRSAELRQEQTKYWEPEAYRRHLIDRATAATTKEAQLMHRYEMGVHEKSLYAGAPTGGGAGAVRAPTCPTSPSPIRSPRPHPRRSPPPRPGRRCGDCREDGLRVDG